MKNFIFILVFMISVEMILAKDPAVCRTVPGYQFRYTTQDRQNPANNVLWLEDNKGFRITEIRGAECSKITVTAGKVFWLEYPSHEIYGFDIKSRFLENYSEGGQFLVSPDGHRMVVERTGTLGLVTLQNRSEVSFAGLPERVFAPGENAAVFLGWSADGQNFWFAQAGPKNRPMDLQVLTHRGDLITTNMRVDPLLESVFNLNFGWMTQNNGTELAVLGLVHEKKIIVTTFEVGEKTRPRWTSAGHLKYFIKGKEQTLLMADIKSRLEASSASTSTISKREFIPLSW